LKPFQYKQFSEELINQEGNQITEDIDHTLDTQSHQADSMRDFAKMKRKNGEHRQLNNILDESRDT